MNNISWAADPENQAKDLAGFGDFNIAQAAVNDHYSTHEARADELGKLSEKIGDYATAQQSELRTLVSAVQGDDLEAMYGQKEALKNHDSNIQSTVKDLQKVFRHMGITLKQYDVKCEMLYTEGLDYVNLKVQEAQAADPNISAADLKVVRKNAIQFYSQNFARAKT